MWQQLYHSLLELSWIELWASFTGLLYIVLAARNSRWCWFFGLISVLLWGYATFFYYQYYMDAGLQLFYAGMSIAGWINWSRKNTKEVSSISVMSNIEWKQFWVLGLSGSLLASILLKYFTSASLPILDSLTSVFSILATFLLLKRKIENWWVWIVVDLVYVGMYFYKGALLFGMMFILYTIMAIIGYFHWRRIKSEDKRN